MKLLALVLSVVCSSSMAMADMDCKISSNETITIQTARDVCPPTVDGPVEQSAQGANGEYSQSIQVFQLAAKNEDVKVEGSKKYKQTTCQYMSLYQCRNLGPCQKQIEKMNCRFAPVAQ